MIDVLIEVVSGDAARFTVAVRAESIPRAVNVASARYRGAQVQVVFPIDPEIFFVKDSSAADLVELEAPESMVG